MLDYVYMDPARLLRTSRTPQGHQPCIFRKLLPAPNPPCRLTSHRSNLISRTLQGFKASLSVVITSSQGLCKASASLHYPYSNLLLKGTARFVRLNLICPCLVCVTLQGKASARLQSLCSNLFLKGSARLQQGTLPFVKGYAREGFNERSSSSLSQSDTVPETNRYALPTS